LRKLDITEYRNSETPMQLNYIPENITKLIFNVLLTNESLVFHIHKSLSQYNVSEV